MRRKSKSHSKIPLFVDDSVIERIKLSYCLHGIVRLRKDGKSYSLSPEKTSKHESAFIRLADRFIKENFDDIEGYIGTAYQMYNPIYPNMLLSNDVMVKYRDTLPDRMEKLDSDFYSSYNATCCRCSELKILYGNDYIRYLLLCKDINPLFVFWYVVVSGFSDIPSTLYDRAKLEYLLWPFGYCNSDVWYPVLSDIKFVEPV